MSAEGYRRKRLAKRAAWTAPAAPDAAPLPAAVPPEPVVCAPAPADAPEPTPPDRASDR